MSTSFGDSYDLESHGSEKQNKNSKKLMEKSCLRRVSVAMQSLVELI